MDALDDPLAFAAALPPGDPVQQRVLLGLARRAAAQTGPLREQLVARLVARAAGMAPATAPAVAAPATVSPLAELLQALQAGATPGLRCVQAHESTWQHLRLNRRLAEVSAPVPEHLGPLNSQVLVARALQQAQGLSPAYLQALLAQLEGLAAAPPAAEPEARPRPAARKTAARRR